MGERKKTSELFFGHFSFMVLFGACINRSLVTISRTAQHVLYDPNVIIGFIPGNNMYFLIHFDSREKKFFLRRGSEREKRNIPNNRSGVI